MVLVMGVHQMGMVAVPAMNQPPTTVVVVAVVRQAGPVATDIKVP